MVSLELDGAVADPRLHVEVAEAGGTVSWAVANAGDRPVAVDRVQLRFGLRRDGEVRLLRHGWQSWSVTGDAVLGRDRDESLEEPGAPGLVRAIFHADADPVAAGVIRSELVTALTDSSEDGVCIGFDGGDRHDGTFRVSDGLVLAEAYLGGAVLEPGERRPLHDLRVFEGETDDALGGWAAWAGERAGARTSAPCRVGWCSWYQYFHDITEAALRSNLALARDWPFDVFQLDDGYQAAIGDWLTNAPTFPTPLDRLAAEIEATGFVPGLWLAPFLVSPRSATAAQHHPEWIVHRASGRPAIGNVNPGWGGEQWVLDTTRPDVLDHLESLARTLVAMGWRYLKLDFTYAASFTAEWHDRSLTPAQRVRAAYDAIRRGAGEDTFLLGCGAPLGPCIGVVDGMRIGPDVAPHWEPRPTGPYAGTAPSVANALRNAVARSFQHRRLWLNDPDCVLLRTRDTELTEAQVRAWADEVARSGGMVVVSDDLALLDDAAGELLRAVIETGRAADEAARLRARRS